jgi:hypothetical protein
LFMPAGGVEFVLERLLSHSRSVATAIIGL